MGVSHGTIKFNITVEDGADVLNYLVKTLKVDPEDRNLPAGVAILLNVLQDACGEWGVCPKCGDEVDTDWDYEGGCMCVGCLNNAFP